MPQKRKAGHYNQYLRTNDPSIDVPKRTWYRMQKRERTAEYKIDQSHTEEEVFEDNDEPTTPGIDIGLAAEPFLPVSRCDDIGLGHVAESEVDTPSTEQHELSPIDVNEETLDFEDCLLPVSG